MKYKSIKMSTKDKVKREKKYSVIERNRSRMVVVSEDGEFGVKKESSLYMKS